MATWPSTLPLPSVAFSGGVKPNVIASEMGTGYVRQRRRFSEDIEVATFSVAMTPVQFVATFRPFHKTTISGGNDWFTMAVNMNGSLVNYTVRFVMGAYNYQKLDNSVQVEAEMEIKL